MSVITSKQNERIRATKRLQRRRYREETGLFLAEGLRLVEDVLSSSKVLELYYTDELLKSDRGRVLLDSCVKHGILLFHCSEPVFAELSMTENTQGVVAVVKQPQPILDWQPHLKQGIILVIDRIQDPGNLGTILRTSLAVGIDGVWLLKGTVDVFNPKVVRSSMGAITKLNYSHLTNDQCLTLAQKYNLELIVTDLAGGHEYYDVDYSQPLALVVGNEANGVDPGLISASPKSVYIPTVDLVESLNVAVASSVLLYEVRRQRRRKL